MTCTLTFHRFTDANFPPRPLAMTSRLQAGIPKMFGWQLRPGHDVYIWIDASRGLLRDDSVAWFLEQLEPASSSCCSGIRSGRPSKPNTSS
jgi:hypothetical protein